MHSTLDKPFPSTSLTIYASRKYNITYVFFSNIICNPSSAACPRIGSGLNKWHANNNFLTFKGPHGQFNHAYCLVHHRIWSFSSCVINPSQVCSPLLHPKNLSSIMKNVLIRWKLCIDSHAHKNWKKILKISLNKAYNPVWYLPS